jgi:hypothetical protein
VITRFAIGITSMLRSVILPHPMVIAPPVGLLTELLSLTVPLAVRIRCMRARTASIGTAVTHVVALLSRSVCIGVEPGGRSCDFIVLNIVVYYTYIVTYWSCRSP